MLKKKLNTVETFYNEGFKIERNGEVIILTPEEMRLFKELDSALDGRGSIEWYLDQIEFKYISASSDDVTKLKKMLSDDNACYQVNQTFLEYAMSEAGEEEREAVRYGLKHAMREGDC